MRPFTNLFRINGKPMLAPDEDMAATYTDLDSNDSGRDEAGNQHRFVLRYKVGKWPFVYSHITEEELRYMEELFGDEPEFDFTRPDRLNMEEEVTTKAYRSNYGITWHNLRAGHFRNYKFNIIEC